MRAYATSLAAVFLALGIGILLGTVIVDKGTVSRQQNALLKSIESKVSSVSEDNKALKKEVDSSHKFEQEVLPHLISEKLDGKKIAIISNDADTKLLDLINNSVAGAGGNVVHFNLQKKFFEQSSENLEIIKKFQPTSSASVEAVESVPELFGSFIGSSDGKKIEALKTDGFYSIEGDADTVFAAVLVVIDIKNKDSLNDYFKPLVTTISRYEMPTVIGQSHDELENLVRFFVNDRTMIIDNIDTVPGQISMVLGLNGALGNFGEKSGSESLIPEVKNENR